MPGPCRPTTPKQVDIVRVVQVVTGRGRGASDDDPYRSVMQWWSFEGKLLGEEDPFTTSSIVDLEPALAKAVSECKAYAKDGKATPVEVDHLHASLQAIINRAKEK